DRPRAEPPAWGRRPPRAAARAAGRRGRCSPGGRCSWSSSRGRSLLFPYLLFSLVVALILMLRGLVLSAFGTASSSTPLVKRASTLFGSIWTGSVKLRVNLPVRRS